jgi:hypothetical protein
MEATTMGANDNVVPLDDTRPAALMAEVKDDIARNRMRERLQVLEAWKLDADETELKWIDSHERYLNYLLDPARVHTDSHEPGWSEMRRLAGEYHDPEEMIR